MHAPPCTHDYLGAALLAMLKEAGATFYRGMGAVASHLAGTVRSLYHRCEPWYSHAACTMRQGVLAGRSDKSERSHRCRPFMLTACGLPVLPQVLSAADAVTNMMKLMPPLG